MLTDLMTKALARERHGRLCELIKLGGLSGNTSPSSFEVLSEFGSKEDSELETSE